MLKNLFEWQKECLEIWFKNKCRGIINVTTGVGKTVFAIAAISKLEETQGNEADIRIKVVVPKTFLTHQWKKAISEELNIADDQIGYYYGARKDNPDKKIMIYVINSARYSLARHILADMESGLSVFLIADECHHYGSEENYKIFDFIPFISEKKARYYSLGLSATPEILGYSTNLIPALGNEIYKFDLSDAVQSNVVCDFYVFNVQLAFSGEEKVDFDEYTEKIKTLYSKIRKGSPHLKNLRRELFFAELKNIMATSDNQKMVDMIAAFLHLTQKRTELIYFATARRKCTYELVKNIRNDAGIIIFGERIEMAEMIYEDLCASFPGQVGKYHSMMSNQEKKNVLYRYQNSEIRILVSCRALDEGLNVPETDVGIIVSSSASDRQKIQRLGRILRRKNTGDAACLYHLYLEGSGENPEFIGEMKDGFENIKTFTTYFDAEKSAFSFPEYENISRKVIEKLPDKILTTPVLHELERNIKRGKINSDFLMTEKNCKEKIKTAVSGDERNYYITMLHIIRERELQATPLLEPVPVEIW